MKRRHIYYLLTFIATITAIALWILHSRDNNSNTTPPPTPLNFLLDNDMSTFDETKGFDREINAFMHKWELAGGSFALMRNDSLLYAKGYGYADKQLETTCDVNHVFRIASASKLITATAIMKLVEQEKLTLSDIVFGEEGILNDSLFLDIYDKRLKRITVEHLLCHTSGLLTPVRDPAFSNYTVAQSLGKELPLSVDDLVEYATHYRLRAQPGGIYRYSNLGYIILGKVIERVSGMPYESYVQDSILQPAGCYNIYIGRNFSENRPSNEVQYHEVKEAEPVEAYDGSGILTMKSNGGNNVTLLSAAGGWVASPTELLKFVAAIDGCDIQKDILAPESITTMTLGNSQQKPMGWASVYGEEWQRSGSMAGTCALIKKQSDGYTWVFITNSSAWIGFHLSDYLSSYISRAIAKVKEWPTRDLFATRSNNKNPLAPPPPSSITD